MFFSWSLTLHTRTQLGWQRNGWSEETQHVDFHRIPQHWNKWKERGSSLLGLGFSSFLPASRRPPSASPSPPPPHHTSTSRLQPLPAPGSDALEIGISLLPTSRNFSSPSRLAPRAEAHPERGPASPNGRHLPPPAPAPAPPRPGPLRPRRRRRGVQDRLRLLRQPERAPGTRRNNAHLRWPCSLALAHFRWDEIVTGLFRLRFFLQPIWDAVAGFDPQVFVWLGDNVYGDSKRPFRVFGKERTVGPWKNVPRFYPSTEEELRRRYQLGKAQPGYARLREKAQVRFSSGPFLVAARGIDLLVLAQPWGCSFESASLLQTIKYYCLIKFHWPHSWADHLTEVKNAFHIKSYQIRSQLYYGV